MDGVAIMAPESPQFRDAMAWLLERGIKVVQFLSGQEKLADADFAGAIVGKLIGRFPRQARGDLVLDETMMAQESIARRLGFNSTTNSQFPHLQGLPSLETYGDEKRAQTAIRRTLENNTSINAAYMLCAECGSPYSDGGNRTKPAH